MPIIDRKSFFAAYKAGRRNFRGLRLHNVDLGESQGAMKKPILRDCDFSKAVLDECKFVGAEMNNCLFTEAKLHGSNFARANLSGSRLDNASLVWCNLNLADLSRTSLRGTELGATMVRGANFANSILTGADLHSAHFEDVFFDGARASRIKLGETSLLGCDLEVFVNARVDRRGRPSTVDWRSVALSLTLPRDSLKAFLLTTGMPETVAEWTIESVRALDPAELFAMMQSTFISYGSPDEAFVVMLREELHRNGVTTFFFRDDAVPGEKLHRLMRDGVNSHDRVILICSKESLDRPGVLNEIEETLQRESRDGGASYLIPIRLDDYVFNGWSPTKKDVAQAVRDRVVGDFRKCRKDKSAFAKALKPLLAALRKKRPTTATP